jgi:hypothetical protein
MIFAVGTQRLNDMVRIGIAEKVLKSVIDFS